MKHFLTVLFALSATVIPMSSQKVASDRLFIPASKSRSVLSVDRTLGQSPVLREHLASACNKGKDEAEMITATIKFPELGTEWDMPFRWVMVYNEEGYYDSMFVPSEDENGNPSANMRFQVPPGNYDFLSIFWKLEPQTHMGYGPFTYYIAENIDVSDGSTIELRPQDSNVCLTMKTTIPNGEDARFPKVTRNSDGEEEILENGNIEEAWIKELVIFKGQRIIQDTWYNAGGMELVGGPDGTFSAGQRCNIYVNAVSDDYLFRQIRCMISEDLSDGVYFAVTECSGGVEGTYTNDSRYTLEESGISFTPANDKYPHRMIDDMPPSPYHLYINPYFTDGTISPREYCDGITAQVDGIWKIYVSGPEKPIDGELYFAYLKNLEDAHIPFSEDDFEWVYPTEIRSDLIFPFTENGSVMTNNPWGRFAVHPGGEKTPYCTFRDNSPFAIQSGKNRVGIGNSAPLLISAVYPEYDGESGEMAEYLDYFYTGRLNEKLQSTAYMSIATEKTPATADSKTFEIFTDNFGIEGIIGGNKATLTYTEGNNPPTVTALQFRNSDDEVTQIFSEPAEARMILGAADFSCKPDNASVETSGVWLEPSAPARISVCVKPTGSDTSETLDLELIRESGLPDDSGFGTIYTAPLSDLNISSTTGWFDITIEVEDAQGARQTQTLSPAFKIESLAGAALLPNDDDSIRVEGNRIAAPEGSRIYSFNGMETNAETLPAGYYIVVTPTLGSVKVVIPQ